MMTVASRLGFGWKKEGGAPCPPQVQMSVLRRLWSRGNGAAFGCRSAL